MHDLPEVQRSGPTTLQRRPHAGKGASSMKDMPCLQESANAQAISVLDVSAGIEASRCTHMTA